MRHVTTDDPLEASFAPFRDLQPTDAEICAVVKRVRRRRLRPRRTRRLLTVMAAVLAGSAAAAAAAVTTFSALTGTFLGAGDRDATALGTGEKIALGAPDELSVGTKLTHDIRFAPGYGSWRARTIVFQTSLHGGSPAAGHAFMTASALRWQVAESAVCSWLEYYVVSRAAGNRTAATRAAAQITAAPRWPAITGLSYPSGLGAVVAATDAGDPKLVRALIEAGRTPCEPSGAPFPSTRMPVAEQRAKAAAAERLGRREIATDPVARRLGITTQPRDH